MNYTTQFHSPIGTLTLSCDGDKLSGLWLENQKYFGGSGLEGAVRKDDLPLFDQTKEWLERYFAGKRPVISELPLAPAGSDFRQRVWKLLCEIPYGEVVTYGQIARQISAEGGSKSLSSQAVGGAVGHNRISIIIPCHRVVGSNGSLTGYAGGIDVKIRLLEHEGVDMSHLYIPKKLRTDPL